MRRLVLYFLVFYSFGCKDSVVTKPMKYNRFGIDYSCSATYDNNKIASILCLSSEQDTILTESFNNRTGEGVTELRYMTGEIKEVGKYCNNEVCDVWKEYYKSGDLKSYKYFNTENDTILLFYKKTYLKNGDLHEMMLPLKYSVEPNDTILSIGKKYSLFIDLLYSEYDTVNTLIIVNPSESSIVTKDTSYYSGRTGNIEFVPQELGEHSLHGAFIEVNGAEENPIEKNLAEKRILFTYTVK